MNKLELKHIAPYLPYGLKVYVCYNEFFLTVEDEMENGTISVSDTIENNHKPILRPLSDLTKEIELNGERFVPIEKLKETNIENIYFYDTQIWIDENNRGASYCDLGVFGISRIMQTCIEWHFDVFGLIPKNLAIDINTLSNASN